MTFQNISRNYLNNLEEAYQESERTGEFTPELSYRLILDQFFAELSNYISSEINKIHEPTRQARAGHPDWKFYNSRNFGIYGYLEAKGLDPNNILRVDVSSNQIQKYLSLGRKLILTDGIDFAFFVPEHNSETILSLTPKPVSGSRWGININPHLEEYFRLFFRDSEPITCSDSELIENVGKRAKLISKGVEELSDLPLGAGFNDDENRTIEILRDLKQIVENHHDPTLRKGKLFADFVAQVLVFGLLYAHRIICLNTHEPTERLEKIQGFWSNILYRPYTDRLRPFRGLIDLLSPELRLPGEIGTWYYDCCQFLANINLSQQQQEIPDYHQLFEHFLSVFDPQTQFDFGAFYTPPALARYTVNLTESIIEDEFPNLSLFQDQNKLIDPCCGTGTFLEQLIVKAGDRARIPKIIGFEILPGPYALAHYRLSMLAQTNGPLENTSIVLTNTLSDELEQQGENGESQNLIDQEQRLAHSLSRIPLTLVIGNPPSSDSSSNSRGPLFSIIQSLLEDFRPPVDERGSRQNIQMQIQNEFVKFLRWACDKLTQNHPAALAMVLPSSFANSVSYKYARRWLLEHFGKIWVVDLDQDARTGIRSSSIFKTLQGRMLLVAVTGAPNCEEIVQIRYKSLFHLDRAQKFTELNRERDVQSYLSEFSDFEIDQQTLSFRPALNYDENLYRQFWPLRPVGRAAGETEPHIFERHCSGIKLAPSSILIHTKKPFLIRRSLFIANLRNSAQQIIHGWFQGQRKTPSENKFTESVRNAIGQAVHRYQSESNEIIRDYCYRPFLSLYALIDEETLNVLQTTAGSGTRSRPEIRSAYSLPDTIGIAVAPAPKDIGESLHRFVSFCWHLPDNDLCKRQNAHIYCNNFPVYKPPRGHWNSTPLPNINQHISRLLNTDGVISAEDILFYVYSILCSDLFLDVFEGALFTDAGSTPIKIPIVSDLDIFEGLSIKGRELAELERKTQGEPIPVLSESYSRFEDLFEGSFRFGAHSIDEDSLSIILKSQDNNELKLGPISLDVLKFKVSGYNVIQQYLKQYTWNYSRKEFDENDFQEFLFLLQRISQQIEIVSEIDDHVKNILAGNVPLLAPE